MLSPELLISAYLQGYFPMGDSDSGEIHWYRPDPRAILPLDQFHASRSLLRTVRRSVYEVTVDTEFLKVMKSCAAREETWITPPFYDSYGKLFDLGFSHSIEVWRHKELVGGLYGVSIGAAFFAESKFHKATDASKVALLKLVQILKRKQFQLLEVQYVTPHLKSLGAVEVAGAHYEELLTKATAVKARWTKGE